jgi:hypothetical protein
MTRPEKVIGFLDIFGNWDPSLIFVMIGAIGIHTAVYHSIKKKSSPVMSTRWHLPQKTEITKSLLIGALLFGMGWGLAGYCPGPALTSVMTLNSGTLTFILSMVVGMFSFKIYTKLFPKISN